MDVLSNNLVNSSYYRSSRVVEDIANKIFEKFLKFKRVSRESESCEKSSCQSCRSIHFIKILEAVEKNEPVIFVLPAFPGKSPNLEKVLGVLPDLAEKLSLSFLNSLCESVREFYSPGVKIILCSDGRVFSDVVGIKESNVSEYQTELKKIIDKNNYREISLINLDDFYGDLDFLEMRSDLLKNYGNSLESLKSKIKNESEDIGSAEAKRMYCGITRFLFEDSIFESQRKSRSLLQREARVKAYEVIRRSNAWSELIKNKFPHAVRLSIHPQVCGSQKLGLRLIADESWMTPWHGVAVKSGSKFTLMKKKTAESFGAKLIQDPNGKPSHYELLEPQTSTVKEL